MALDEGRVGETGRDGGKTGEQAPARTDVQPPEDEEEQSSDADLDDKREHFGRPPRAGQDQLERPGLKLPVGVDRGPMSREQPLASVNEVEEVSRVCPAVAGRRRGSNRQDRQPDPSNRRAPEVPHSGRYRRQKGGG